MDIIVFKALYLPVVRLFFRACISMRARRSSNFGLYRFFTIWPYFVLFCSEFLFLAYVCIAHRRCYVRVISDCYCPASSRLCFLCYRVDIFNPDPFCLTRSPRRRLYLYLHHCLSFYWCGLTQVNPVLYLKAFAFIFFW